MSFGEKKKYKNKIYVEVENMDENRYLNDLKKNLR